MMMMLMQNPASMNQPNSMLPLLFLNDDNDKLDFKTLFLLTNTMRNDCQHDTKSQMGLYLPALMNVSYSYYVAYPKHEETVLMKVTPSEERSLNFCYKKRV